ncbi:MAG TPA: type II toxin-antitoxin system HicA family toxin [Bryobacteraceae bacterium]|mgnify:CR=1 FL=1|nr:type II toxin-antitoxin system HicA family toxin [Bryobacteraceae bacterium]HOL70097.1 type II toxin-antitoxin system HicA family toxin [Bryobacteraceae bacterium]HOQ43833.1 type II toxin-antitoxin system HicA family toxin [Bryobacteraceae bacterium]HPQ14707.1 type II toxin-antitoxin system HicA family toxin [Bryobacteraceae bacterium]HPU71724.1 type II toxin-antitoxin system HicA family toxin [Bryobacteraceae bacterium]
MPKLRVLSGDEVVRILHSFGFAPVSRRGSHIKLQRKLPNGSRQSLTVPLHREMDRGTLLAIYRQALRFIPEDELRSRFYID